MSVDVAVICCLVTYFKQNLANMLEDWYIFHLKGEIHRSVVRTKTSLHVIREPRYNQIQMGYQISKILDIAQSSAL